MAAIFKVGIDIAVADILANGQQIVETMLEFVANAALFLHEIIIVRVAFVEVGNLAIGRIVERRRAAGHRAGKLAEECKARVFIRLYGE